MAGPPDPITIRDLLGGRNGTDPPLSLPDNQCVEALNVDWYQATLARKRGGSTAVSETGGTAFSSGIQSLFRHVPGNSEAAAEFWGIDGAATPIVKRMTGGTTFADVTLSDAIATKPQEVNAATLNGKLFLAYDSTADRLHVYDPNLASPRVRRVGFATPAAPTAANNGSGSYPAITRYYRVRWLQYSSPTVYRRSEPGAVLTFTPSGSGTDVTVTRPTAASEQETHWEVEGSRDGTTFYQLAGAGGIDSPIAIATTTYTDDNAIDDYDNGTLSEDVGEFIPPTSVKYLLTDGNRLLLAGAWETGGKNSRVWFTPVLGSTDHGDDERIPNTTDQKNWVDLNENDGGFITGLGGPLDGAPWAFKYRQIWKLVPTGDVDTPYLPRKRTDGIGCIAHKTIVVGEDEAGRPALYFLSHRGPYRVGANGLQYLGRDNEDVWLGMNLGATTVVGFTLWHPDKHQVWFYVATGSSNDPDVKMCFDVKLGVPDEKNQVRGGWSKHTGDSCSARCGTLMSNTLGATMSKDLKPYIGRSSGTAIQKADTTSLTDAGTAFRAYVTTRCLPTQKQMWHHAGVGEPHLQAVAVDDTWISITIVRDFGIETRSGVIELTPYFNETRVTRKYAGLELSGASMVQLTIGDAYAVSRGWTLDTVMVPIGQEEHR